MIIAMSHKLTTGSCYHDLGTDYYTRRTPEKLIRRKIADLQAPDTPLSRQPHRHLSSPRASCGRGIFKSTTGDPGGDGQRAVKMVVRSGCRGDGQGRRLRDGGPWVIPLALCGV